jgi:hypothetical protein
MGLHQDFRFDFESPDAVRQFLRELAGIASLSEREGEFFVFSQRAGDPEFTFDCELTGDGIRSERAGEYFPFLGLFIEALTGQFGAVTVEDA